MTKRIARDQWRHRRGIPRGLRFWEKVAKGEGCWEWTGWRNHQGYAVLSTGPKGGQKRELGHRVSWEINVGPIPDGIRVLHRCDNPPCVRPDHLFLGTQADNIADMVAKGRARHRGKLTPETVRAIRASTGPIRAIGDQYGVAYSQVSRIRLGQAWKSVA